MRVETKDYVFVGLQGILFMAYIFELKTIDLSSIPNYMNFVALGILFLGLVIVLLAFLQLNVNISPFPKPKSSVVLVQNRIFGILRHPIYAGILYAAFGYAIYIESLYKLIITVLLLILFYKKSVYEEQKLIEKFPKYYIYKKRVGRFFFKFL